MAKLRFIDVEIWGKVWFRKLTPAQQDFYFYLVSNCDHAGIYDVDLETAKYYIGEDVGNPIVYFGDNFRIHQMEDSRWFLPDFLKLQYRTSLNSKKPAIVSVRRRLDECNLREFVIKQFGNDYLMIKDKDEDMVKDAHNNKNIDTDKK